MSIVQSFEVELTENWGGRGRGEVGGEEADRTLFKFVLGLAYASAYP